MQTVTLNNGVQLPIVGFGVFQIDDTQTEQAVSDALTAGYRLIDTAASYGNEAAVGHAIKNSGIPREEHQNADYQAQMRDLGVQIESWGPFAEGRNNLFIDPVLTEIGQAHGKSVAQLVVRWLIQRGVVVIPKSVRPERMVQNLDVFDFALTDEEMTRIAGMDLGTSQFFDHRDPDMVRHLGSRRVD